MVYGRYGRNKTLGKKVKETNKFLMAFTIDQNEDAIEGKDSSTNC